MGLDWMLRSRRDGRVIDRAPGDLAFPIETAVVRPAEYQRFAQPDDRAAIDGLERGQVLLSRSAADLRRAQVGMRLVLRGRTVRVAGIVSDATAQGYEMLAAPPAPSLWPGTIRSVLVRAEDEVTKQRIIHVTRRAVGDKRPLRVAGEDATRFLRYADQIHPLVRFKEAFGEFAARDGSGNSLILEGAWRDRRITTESVPILGNVTCHRDLFPQLRGALKQLRDEGNGHMIRPGEYAGCFNARYVATAPGIRISRHTWGIAFDINTSNNAFGAEPNQPSRLVKVMREWGFAWGGYWPLPDGMHFEWRRFTEAA